MRKIPTLFERKFDDSRVKEVLPVVTKGMEWVLDGDGIATIKYDGACCAIIKGEFHKRYDAKNGKPVPEGAIKCQEEADPITGHLPCWVKCDRFNPTDKWFWSAFDVLVATLPCYPRDAKTLDGTYEAIGKHFRGNPYNMDRDILVQHGRNTIEVERTFDGIKKYLLENYIEGIVFWKDGEPKCKIKRSDFGFEWNNKKGVEAVK